jgi:hypothetical protein
MDRRTGLSGSYRGLPGGARRPHLLMEGIVSEETVDPIVTEVEANGVATRTVADLPDEIYHHRPEWSVSQLKLLPEEPEMFWGRHIAHLEDFQLKESPQMRLGTAVHEALLQGMDLRIIPRNVLSKSGSRAGGEWKAFAEEHAGESWLKEDEAEPAQCALESVRKDRKARALLELPGDAELAVFWRDEFTSLPMRGRLDRLVRVGGGLVLDLKTANDPTEYGFPFACLDRKYHVQAACYMEAAENVTGTQPEAFLFIAVQVEAPYICRVYSCRREMLELGFTRLRESLADLKARLDSDDWHGRGYQEVTLLDLPQKAYKSFNQ